MRIDLLHNKIIKDTLTERFEESVRSVLVPLVCGVYPEADGILMYEDYIADGFAVGERWFYPLTVRCAGESRRLWISWSFDAERFASRSPYSYLGEEPLDFEIEDEVPEELEAALVGRALDYDEGALKINVRAASDDPLILVGHYSQTFVDELAAQMTVEISRAMALEGLGTSTIELELTFAPGTYMEHTSENVTYRRLLLVDGASRPRDFWVKWTRIGGGVAYTVSDHIANENILFELGEDVAHKIREKEFRFLCSSNPNAYQAAMGKRTVTEWRDLIKRAIRRGEIVKTESELVIAEHAGDVHDKMAELLEGLGYKPKESAAEVATDDAGFDAVMDMARAALRRSDALMADSSEDESDKPRDDGEAEEIAEATAAAAEEDAFLMSGLELARDELGIEPRDESEDAEAEADVEPEDEEIEAEPEREEEDEEFEADAEDEEIDTEDEPEVIEAPVASEPEYATPITIDELFRRADEDIAEEAAREDAEPARESAYSAFDTDDAPIVDTPEVINEDDEDEIEPAEAEEVEADEVEADAEIEAEPVEVDCEVEQILPEEVEDRAELDRLREESIRREIEARIRLEYEEKARARAEAELERLLAESRALREENERLAKAARDAHELHQQALSDQLDAAERARATEDSLRRELEAKERQEARERDRLAEAARIAVEEQRRYEAIERENREREEAERLAEEERAREAERLEQARLAAESEFITKRARIIFRYAPDADVINNIKAVIQETIRRENKQHVRIHMKAYKEERDVVILDVLKMPRAEQELLVAIVKAIGNARMGVSRIILE